MIQSFLAKYTLSAKLAEEFGTSGVFLSNLLKRKGILPISGPSIDGGIQYIFLKSDLESIDLNEIIPAVKLENKRKQKRLVLIDSKCAAEILGIDVRALAKLVKNGVLDPSTSRQSAHKRCHFFNLFIVERLKNQVSNYHQLVSIAVAAKMLGEAHIPFLVNWIQSGYLEVVARTSNKRYLRIRDVRALITLRRKALTTGEAAKYLGVATTTVLRLGRSGELKVIKKAGVDHTPRNLYWRRDIERLNIFT
jgi:excisionase family DNA binding protein